MLFALMNPILVLEIAGFGVKQRDRFLGRDIDVSVVDAQEAGVAEHDDPA